MFFGDDRQLSLESCKPVARRLEPVFFFGAGLLAFCERPSVSFQIFFELNPISSDAVEFQARVRKAGLDALRLFSELPAFVIECKNIFFLRLLLRPEVFQFLRQSSYAVLQTGYPVLG